MFLETSLRIELNVRGSRRREIRQDLKTCLALEECLEEVRREVSAFFDRPRLCRELPSTASLRGLIGRLEQILFAKAAAHFGRVRLAEGLPDEYRLVDLNVLPDQAAIDSAGAEYLRTLCLVSWVEKACDYAWDKATERNLGSMAYQAANQLAAGTLLLQLVCCDPVQHERRSIAAMEAALLGGLRNLEVSITRLVTSRVVRLFYSLHDEFFAASPEESGEQYYLMA